MVVKWAHSGQEFKFLITDLVLKSEITFSFVDIALAIASIGTIQKHPLANVLQNRCS